jgi:mono/diheme cytochrome c family protein
MMRVNALWAGVLFMAAGGALAQVPLRGSSSRAGGTATVGETVYRQHCLGCHGEGGDGHGPAAAALFPAPRDFVNGSFRLRSTRTGTPPSDADLLAVVTRGIPGYPMPSFAFLPLKQRKAAVAYVKTLSPLFARADHAPQPVEIGSSPTSSAATLAAGRTVFERLACGACHGDSGRGDGAMAEYLRDERQSPIRPRNLVTDPFKGGTSVRDIYLRLASGMDGTPMKAVDDDKASLEQRWQLAAYVASLRADATQTESAENDDYVIDSGRIAGPVPIAEPLADVWTFAPSRRVSLYPLSSPQGQRRSLVVKSLHNERTIAFRLEWADATHDDDTARPEKFADGAAIQFVSGSRDAFLGMGDQLTPVRIWHWKADWQREIADRRRPPPTAAPPQDDASYPFPAMSAIAANNQFARAERSSPVEEVTASGSATLRPTAVQHVKGAGVWSAGTWYVVLARDVDAASDQPVAGSNVKLALAVWDGADHDRGGRKAVSTWYRLNTDK